MVASGDKSSNRLVDIESMTEEEMMIVQKYYQKLSELSEKEKTLQTSHSIEEAEENHQEKNSSSSKKTPTQKTTVRKTAKSNTKSK